MSWKLKTFDQLTNSQLYNIIKERINIFVVEQNCPYRELDDIDKVSYHLFYEKESQINAYCRIIPKGYSYQEVSIGRVIVNKEYRRTGIGSILMKKAIDFVEKEISDTKIKIQAQDYLRDFYGGFGFKVISEVYLEDGIPHVDMMRDDKQEQ